MTKEEIKQKRERVTHKNCPGLESEEPQFECPDCGDKYFCYYEGADCSCGKIGLCKSCAEKHEQMGHK